MNCFRSESSWVAFDEKVHVIRHETVRGNLEVLVGGSLREMRTRELDVVGVQEVTPSLECAKGQEISVRANVVEAGECSGYEVMAEGSASDTPGPPEGSPHVVVLGRSRRPPRKAAPLVQRGKGDGEGGKGAAGAGKGDGCGEP